MDALHMLDGKDRRDLLRTSPELLLGRIIQLNRKSRYHNMLNAIELASTLMELRERALRFARRRLRAAGQA
jgi:hypothetical protein